MNASTNIPQAKDQLRQEMRESLRTITPGQRQAWSGRLIHHLTSDASWVPRNGVVALFGGLKAEPDLWPLVSWLGERQVQAAFFAIGDDGQMTAHRVTSPQDLTTGPFGVLVPVRRAATAMAVALLDVILVPGLAFGIRDGSRLGRGKGYYDRVLGDPQCRARSIGVCFALQCRETIPREPHDVAVPALVTEDGWRPFSPAVPS